MYKYTNNPNKLQLFYNKQGKVIALLDGEILFKTVIGKRHQLRTPPAWAIDEAVINKSEKMGAKEIHITDSDTDKIFKSPLKTFKQYGIHIERGHGRQIALPLARWHVDDDGEKQAEAFLNH